MFRYDLTHRRPGEAIMADLLLLQMLDLDRCPHCGVDKPSLPAHGTFQTMAQGASGPRVWSAYGCNRCGGVVVASAAAFGLIVQEVFPESRNVPDDIPERAGAYLKQAIASISAPAGAVMLAASAVDAMLKTRGYTDGSLYARIDQAAKDNEITKDMAAWAHAVRLDANNERHADESQPMPTTTDAERCVDFVVALAEIMFTLPARAKRALAPH